MIMHFIPSGKNILKAVFFTLTLLFLVANPLFAQYELEIAFPNLTFTNPIFLTHAGDGTNRVFVVEQAGIIKVFPNSSSTSSAKIFLNISDRIISGGERGLLGLAFHPDYESNGYFYVNYTYATNGNDSTRITRYQVTNNPDSADKNSESQILSFDQPFSNHNGGWIGFRQTDGYLYIGTGDGGSSGDPNNNAQNITVLLGKILRIDVDLGIPYAVPPTNPFYDSTNTLIKKEIYAWGMRNPWRNSFDPVTDWFWSGDVGQGSWEEIDLIENGKNYGWRCYEGTQPYNTAGCNYPEYIDPIWEYPHSPECSVTGGYVYRGINNPELEGKYIYGDYCSRKVWVLSYDGINPATNEFLTTAAGAITSFGVDELMEIYITSSNGKIYKFSPTISCTDFNITSGWNLVSVPFLNNDMSASNIFPNSGSDVFGYSNGYFIADTLLNGTGYWVKYNEAQIMQICGSRMISSIVVNTGWNLIGPFDTHVDIQNITSTPPNIIISPFFGYSSGYTMADTLMPGKGYWVKTNASGNLQLNTVSN
jgi:glucose/arabinose dehydrogenase